MIENSPNKKDRTARDIAVVLAAIAVIIISAYLLMLIFSNIEPPVDEYVEEETVPVIENTIPDVVMGTNIPNVVKTVDSSDTYASGTHHARVEIEGYEPFDITITSDAAPITAVNFAALVNQGYYNGKIIDRFHEGFIMRGGAGDLGENAANGITAYVQGEIENESEENTLDTEDGSADIDVVMTETPDWYSITGEFQENGYDNPLSREFRRGTVAMTHGNHPDSAVDEFFITLSSAEDIQSVLDGKYAAFGYIDDDGMKIVDRIVADHQNVPGAIADLVVHESKTADGNISEDMPAQKSSYAVIKSITMID